MSGLSARDIGHRVVVRYRLPGGQLTDVLGVLQSLDADSLTVRHSDGTPYAVRIGDVSAAKPIPPLVLRPVDVEQLYLTTALGRPAVETSYVGQWLLRASEGWTGRANSLLPAGDPGMPLADALKHTEAFYDERGLPPLALIRLGTRARRRVPAARLGGVAPGAVGRPGPAYFAGSGERRTGVRGGD